MTKPALVFVYNADAGIFNALADLARKTFSPRTYACNLCALTYDLFGMRKDWKKFLSRLDRPVEFLHADELRARYGVRGVRLPAVFERTDADGLRVAVEAQEINRCRTLGELEDLIARRAG